MGETIQYLPPGLEGRLQLNYARRALASRDGIAIFFDNAGNYLSHRADVILDLHSFAIQYAAEHSGHQVVIWENSCGLTGDPFPNGQVPREIQHLVQRG